MELQTKTRVILGKKVKILRRDGLIPAEVYGRGLANRHLSISKKEFSKIYKTAGEHTVINLITEEKEKIPVLISEVVNESISGEILAIDFHQIRMDEKIQTKVPLEFTGEAPAAKNGLVVVNIVNELEIEALPDKIPHRIEVDIGKLESAGQSIRISELKIPAGVKVLVSDETVIVTVSEKTKEEIEVKPTAPETTQTTEPPETETKTETPQSKAK